ncbi:MAG: HAMP domain-containing sensor histidine kinase [Actinomycetota bacterium]
MSLRIRLLLGVGLVALVQIAAAVAVILVISDQLLDEIDERLIGAASAAPSTERSIDEAGRVGANGNRDIYQGIVRPDGTVMAINVVIDRDQPMPPPRIKPADVDAARTGPTTVGAQEGSLEYRLLSVASDGTGTFVVASPLDGYRWTMSRLIRLVVGTAVVLVITLAAVTWWMLRLGVEPVKRMTMTAESIAAGDLSERIENRHPGTEAGQLGHALNAMMATIQGSFDERTRAEARLRRFVADASHELRTPVATIRGYAELYEAGGLDNRSELDDAMRRTRHESERMSRLIADLLHLAKLDREPLRATEPVDLATLVHDVVNDATRIHPDRTFSAACESEPLVITGDEDLLRQALTNLVSNAVVHTGPGTTTSVHVASRRNEAVLTVVDDGEGMPVDVVERATERFVRGDPSRSRHRGGSGLGLAIVDGIVAAHHGDLQITSSLGGGTEVRITLPTAAPAPSS